MFAHYYYQSFQVWVCFPLSNLASVVEEQPFQDHLITEVQSKASKNKPKTKVLGKKYKHDYHQ